MKEIINIGIGQAGVQISESLIQLYLGEHHLNNQGRKIQDTQTNLEENQKIIVERMHQHLPTIFQETSKQTYRPRFMLIDSEPDVINDLRRSEIASALTPNYLYSGQESANTFARAYYYSNEKFNLKENYENCIRSIAESCDSLEGFMLNHAIDGGTGSGAVATLMERMEDNFPKILKTNFVVSVENGSMNSVVGPYNAALGLARIQPYSNTTIVVSNASLHQIASTNLDIQFPNFKNINALISQTHSTYTVFNRFNNSAMNCDIHDFQTNLAIYPRIHYAIPSFSPLVSQENIYRWGEIYSEDLMLEKCYDRSCQFGYKKNYRMFREDKNMSAIILARGDIDMNRLTKGGRKLIKRKKWVDHLPTALKIGVSPQKSTKFHQNDIEHFLKKSIISYRSSMQLSEMFEYLSQNFDVLYARRAFVHWYIQDGMEEMEFSEAREELSCLEKDYEEILCSDYFGGCEEYDGQDDDQY